MSLRVASFFAGIGGFDLGFEQAGMQVVFQCEVNELATKILTKHWPLIQRHGNIEDLNPSDIPEADLYCGGFPCQDVSQANQGKRQGLNGKRSGLFYTFADLIEARRPRWVVLENVIGLLNSQQGRDFAVILNKMDDLGYGVAWRVFDAKYFGTPQRRRRVFIVASHNSQRAAKVLLDSEATLVVPEEIRRPGQANRTLLRKGSKETNLYSIQHAGIGRDHRAGPQGKGYRNDGETWTLDHRGASDVVCSTNVPFRVRSDPGFPGKLDRSRYALIGNAVCVPVVRWIGEQILAVDNQE